MVGGYFTGNYFYNLVFNPNSDNELIFLAPPNPERTKAQWDEWIQKVTYKEVNAHSFDQLILHSYLIENRSPSDIWVIIFHGYAEDATNMTYAAESFYNIGYNVLLPDLRGNGKSEGNYYGLGWHDRLDVITWIQYINERYPDQKIILYGFASGASAIMMASGESLPENVMLMIADSGYTSIYDECAYQLEVSFNLPAFPFLNFTDYITLLNADFSIKEASSVMQLQKSITPILFIHGDKDTVVPVEMVHQLYASTTAEKELLLIPGADHGESATNNSSLYWSTIKEFIQKYLDR